MSITINGQAAQPTIRERLDVCPIELRATSPSGAKHTRRLDPHAGNLHIIVPSLVRTRTERPHRYVLLAGGLLAAGVVVTGLGIWFGNVAASERGAFDSWSARNRPFDSSGTHAVGDDELDQCVAVSSRF